MTATSYELIINALR